MSGIYLCSRDLGGLSSINVAKKAARVNELSEACRPEFYQECPIGQANFMPFEEAGDCHYLFRHCFLLHALSYGEINSDYRKQLVLEPLDARGFTGTGQENQAIVEQEDVLETHQEQIGIVSCRLVFSEDNVTEKDIEKYEVTSRRAVVRHKWVVATEAMEDEVQQGYAPVTHNCCTVAFSALEKIVPDLQKIVDPNDINFGIGIQFVNIPKLVVDTSKYGCRKFETIIKFW